MTKSRNINKPKHVWTDAERQVLRERYADTKTKLIAQQLGLTESQVYKQAHAMGLEKSADYLASPDACRLRRGDNVGAAYRFKPGQVPANKGTKGVTGVQAACRATQFKPGQLPGNTMPIGSTRINQDGQLEWKFSDEPGPYNKRWIPVHRKVWIEAHGEIPEGMAVAFKPGMRTTDLALITVDRLELLSRAEVLARNRWQNLPPELREIVTLRAQLTRAINDHR